MKKRQDSARRIRIKVYGPQVKEFLHCFFGVPFNKYWGYSELVFTFECEYCNLVRLEEASRDFDVKLEYKVL